MTATGAGRVCLVIGRQRAEEYAVARARAKDVIVPSGWMLRGMVSRRDTPQARHVARTAAIAATEAALRLGGGGTSVYVILDSLTERTAARACAHGWTIVDTTENAHGESLSSRTEAGV